MRIFPKEIEAGLTDVMALNNTIRFTAKAELIFPANNDEFKQEILKSIKASTGLPTYLKDPNLAYYRSILASVGWNNNDDVFLAEEIYPARFTPEHKPFNFQHNEKDIIGHIVANFMLNEENEEIDIHSDLKDLPSKFHLGNGLVLYTDYYEDKTLRNRMTKIVEEILEGKWRVSLEAWVQDFDYAVKTKDGRDLVIARNDENSFLTAYLRCYGGVGVYNNARIGRLVRNIRFKGEGLVESPGNPYSVILSNQEDFHGVECNEVNEISEIKIMSTTTVDTVAKSEFDRVQSELTSKAALVEALQKEVSEFKSKKYEEEITALKASLKEATETLTAANSESKQLKSDLEVAKASLTETTAKASELQSQIETIEKQRKSTAGVSSLVEAGLKKEEAEKKAETFVAASDEMFEMVVAMTKELVAASKKNPGTNTQDLGTATEVETPVHASATEVTSEDQLQSLSDDIASFFSKENK